MIVDVAGPPKAWTYGDFKASLKMQEEEPVRRFAVFTGVASIWRKSAEAGREIFKSNDGLAARLDSSSCLWSSPP